jgi:DNA-binding MarR family transcriptional regulator
MKENDTMTYSAGIKAMLLSKLYYGALTKKLEHLEVERYFTVLYFLKDNNGCKQQFICDHLLMDKTAMVKIVDYMIKTGMVDRNVNPADRREHFIVLTKKGQRHADDIAGAFQAIDTAMLVNTTKEEQAIFVKVLNQAMHNLQTLPFDDLFFNFKKTTKKKTK